jgi:hypothetical protein
MDTLTAILIVEGADISHGPNEGQPHSEEQYIEAWQFLIDTGLAFKLQGSFGRTASQLIDAGICEPPDPDRPALKALANVYGVNA